MAGERPGTGQRDQVLECGKQWRSCGLAIFGGISICGVVEDYGKTSNTAIRFDFNPKWYDEGVTSDVVSQEELAAKTLDDFALTLGSNTICYQLEMENGLVSPVYQFELNLCDQAPELELEYSFGPSVIEKRIPIMMG